MNESRTFVISALPSICSSACDVHIDQAGSQVTPCKRNRSKNVHESKREAKEYKFQDPQIPGAVAVLLLVPKSNSLERLDVDGSLQNLPTRAVRQLCQISSPPPKKRQQRSDRGKTHHIRTRPKEVEVTRSQGLNGTAPNGFSDIHRRE